jgi:outer membrane protein TolC
LFDAQLSLTRTEQDELSALVQLYKALGGGWSSQAVAASAGEAAARE